MTILSLFHHIHHFKKGHEVHHCGGIHFKVNPKLNYTVKHCLCHRHSIDKKTAIGHATDESLKSVEVEVEFREKCPFGGWHVESGVKKAKK